MGCDSPTVIWERDTRCGTRLAWLPPGRDPTGRCAFGTCDARLLRIKRSELETELLPGPRGWSRGLVNLLASPRWTVSRLSLDQREGLYGTDTGAAGPAIGEMMSSVSVVGTGRRDVGGVGVEGMAVYSETVADLCNFFDADLES